MQAQFAALAKNMEAARSTPSITANASAYSAQLKQVTQLRDGIKEVTNASGEITRVGVPGFNQLMQATGGWNVQTVKAVTSSQQLTKSLMDGKLQVSQLTQGYGKFMTTLRQVANEQEALRKSTAVQWTSSSTGKNMVDLYTPVGAIEASAATIKGTYLTALKSAGQAVQDWGKNTQWAGRQITAGFAMPVAIASTALAVMAKNTDEELTKIVKMYNTSDIEKLYSDPAQQAAAKEQELSQVRQNAFDNAISMAKQYGSAINDTLEIEAQLASKGFTGNGLKQMTDQTMKVSQIGAISSTDAMGLIMSASSAFSIKPQGMSDAMNYLNALKNQTNLTMQDISDSIPKVGATIASLVPASKDGNKALEETGVLLTAFAQGGVAATQGANALKTAIGRAFDPVPKATKEFATLTSAVSDFAGAGGKGIDLNKIKNASGGDPLTYFQNLGKALANVDAVSKETALKDLFGLQQSNRMMIAVNNLVDADPNNPTTQTGAAMQLAQQGPAKWADVTDQEIAQFQQSASGKFTIAVQTMKAQLIQLGLPLLNMVTPLISGLGSVVSIVGSLANGFGKLPGPVQSVLKVFGGLALLSGPFMMMAGIAANWIGMIGKVVGALGLLGSGFKVMNAETAADDQLQKSALQTKDKQLQATSTLAIKMKELVAIMAERTKIQEDMNQAVANGAAVEEEAAKATEDNAVAQTVVGTARRTATKESEDSAVATAELTTATQSDTAAVAVNVEEVLAQIKAINEAAAAAREAAGYSRNALLASLQQAPLALTAGPAWTGNRYPKGGTLGGTFMPTTVSRARSTAAAARMDSMALVDENGYNASLGYGPAMYSAAGTKGTTPFAMGAGPAGLAAVWEKEMAASQAKFRQILANADGEFQAAMTDLSVTEPKVKASAAKAAESIITTTETSLMDELVAMSESGVVSSVPGFRARLAAVATRMNPMNAVNTALSLNASNEAAHASGPSNVIMRPADKAAAEAEAEAAKSSEVVAANSAKTGVSWGKVAGNMTALAIGGSMIAGMAGGSSTLLTNIMQVGLAIGMIGPLIGQIATKFKEIRTANAALAVEGEAGASLLSRGFKSFGSVAMSVISGLGTGLKFMFTNPLGIALTVLAAIAGTIYIIHQQMTKLVTTQDNINKSTESWQKILGYQSTAMKDGDALAAKGASGYVARANAVKQLTEQNQSLTDSLAKAAQGAKGMDNVFNMAFNEALKVKVDGGSTTQAKESFDVALQAAGLKQADIDQLDLKFEKINLDDPSVLQKQLNDQVAAALKPQAQENKEGGYWEQVIDKWFGPKSAGTIGRDFGGDHYVGLSDAAKAAASDAGNAVYNAIQQGLQSGDTGQIDSAVKAMKDSVNNDFDKEFTQLRSNGNNAAVFKQLGITTMSQLSDAINQAAEDAKNGKTTDKDKILQAIIPDIKKSNEFQEFQDTWKGILTSLGKANGLKGAGLDNWVNQMLTATDVSKYFDAQVDNNSKKVLGLGDAFQTAADGAATLADAMDTSNAMITSGAQVTKEMQDAYGGTIKDYTSQMDQAWQQATKAAEKSIQDAGDAQVKGLQKQQKDQDEAYSAQDKAITQHYKDLAAEYDKNVKNKQDEAKAETDAIQSQMDALKKSDTTRQDLYNNEITRLQRLAAAQSNNIDFNAALNSGNLDEAARIYSNNQAQTQQNMLDDQQKALDKQSQAQQDALSGQIQNINDERDAYIQAQQDKKSALSDMEAAEHDALTQQKQNYDDAMQAQIDAAQKATAASVQAYEDRAAKDKQAIDQQIAAITAFVPQSVAQVNTQITQIDGAYSGYGTKLNTHSKEWNAMIVTDLQTNMTKASNALTSDIAWSQIGTYIQNQLDAGANFTLDEALQFLKDGVWPNMKGGTVGGQGVDQGTAANNKRYSGAHGGYTGDGTKFEVAGIVHAGEYVMPMEAVQRIGVNTLNHLAYHPDSKNMTDPGYAHGGYVPGYAGGGYVPSLGSGFMAVKDSAIRGALMRAVAQKAMDMAMIDHMGGGDLSGEVQSALGIDLAGQTWHALDKIRADLFPGSVRTDGYRPGNTAPNGGKDYHNMGEAIDIGWPGNDLNHLAQIAARIGQAFPNSTELIHNPNGSIKNGKIAPPSLWGSSTWNEHKTHVHWAMTPAALAASGATGLGMGMSAAPASLSSNQALVQSIAAQKYGWQGAEWNALYSLLMKESGFRNTAQNPTSSAYGMFQFLDSTWGNYGIGKTADPTQQTLAGLKYIATRYNDPIGAWGHELNYNWYDQGGWLKNGSIGMNQSGKPEPVFTDGQWAILKSLVSSSVNHIGAVQGIDSESGKTYNVNIDMNGAMITGQVDFEQGVYNALVKMDDKLGRSRTVS